MAAKGAYIMCQGCHFSFTPGCSQCPYEENRPKTIHKFVGIQKIKKPQKSRHKSDWKEIRHNKTTIIWEYRKGGLYSITIEARFDKTLNLWLVYGALDGKGIPENPIEVVSKKEAISFIAMLKKQYERGGIPALKNIWGKL